MKNLLFVLALCPVLLFSQDTDKAVQVQEIEPYVYCAVEMTGSYDQHETAFQTLYEQAAMQGLDTNAGAFGIYFSDPSQTPEADLKWEIGFKTDAEKVNKPLVLKKWQYTTIAVTEYEGSFSSEEFGLAHQKLFQWITENGYSPAGPTMETYLDMPTQNSDGEWVGKIRISLPVQKN